MKTNRITHPILAALLAGLAAGAQAEVTADEAKQLGSTLTQLGAVKAGNKEGTIPAYTGGLTKAPPGFKAGSGVWADPFKDEAPLVRIDAKNWQQHADKLSDGQKKGFNAATTKDWDATIDLIKFVDALRKKKAS